MKIFRFLSLFLAFYLAFCPTFSLAASAKEKFCANDRFSAVGKDISSFKDSHIQSARLIQKKNHQQFLQEEIHSRAHHGKSQTIDPNTTLIYGWTRENQNASPLGLVESYPDDPTLQNQGFTYDQALAGILMLEQGDKKGARKVFDFFNSQWEGEGFWSNIFSVENNLSNYAVLKTLSSKAATQADRQFFSNELKGVTNWLKTQAYDATTGLFRRGAYGDPVKALDTNSWAILAIGPGNLKKDFGIDVEALVSNIESTFAVQADGSFGQDALTAKGFDFSDSANASMIGRPARAISQVKM